MPERATPPEVPVRLPAGVAAPAGLLDAFWDYERALLADDVDALDRVFSPGPDTLRGDDAGLLRGHDAIAAFRRGRGGTPARAVLAVEVRPVADDVALVVAVTAPLAGGRGQQTQLWRRGRAGWRVDAAHVSAPAPPIAASTWRVVGSPLAAGAAGGPLAGLTVAVKDVFDVAGSRVGGGVPAYLADPGLGPATAHAPAVAALLAAGASVRGIAQTDELAYSLAGRNPHYGTPANPAVVGGLPGGSSSGPAAAVAQGQASIGLGTDTGGSIRVPASYQGLWGLRSTHGAVGRSGVLPLAPSFDTVGWLTRGAPTLRAAALASLDVVADQRALSPGLAVAPALTALADGAVGAAFDAALATLAGGGHLDDLAVVDLGDLDGLVETFRTVQAAEAWRVHGAWVGAHPDALGADVAARFAWARAVTPAVEAGARAALAAARVRLDEVLGERVLLLPAASSPAPPATSGAQDLDRTRAATLRLTCVAGLTGRPALSVPALGVPQAASALPAPVGLCLLGPRFSDLALIDLGARLAAALTAAPTAAPTGGTP